MRKLILSLFALLFSASVFAAGTPTSYKVTVKAVQLKNSAGQWVTIAAPYQEVDIASASAGQSVASLFSDTVIPAGIYVNFRVVLSETFRVSGTDTVYSTAAGGVLNVSSTDPSKTGSTTTAEWNFDPNNAGSVLGFASLLSSSQPVDCVKVAGTPGEMTVNLNLSNDADSDIFVQGVGDLSIADAVEIKGDSEVTMSFSFDMNDSVLEIDPTPGAVDSGDEVIAFLPPQEGTEFTITVDGVTEVVDSTMMAMEF